MSGIERLTYAVLLGGLALVLQIGACTRKLIKTMRKIEHRRDKE